MRWVGWGRGGAGEEGDGGGGAGFVDLLAYIHISPLIPVPKKRTDLIPRHLFPNDTELSSQDKTRQRDQQESEYEERNGDETTEEGARGDFAVADCCYRCGRVGGKG